MAQAFSSSAGIASANREAATTASPSYQAYQILRTGFTVAPIVAGFDKFFHLLAELGSVSSGIHQQPDRRPRTPIHAGSGHD